MAEADLGSGKSLAAAQDSWICFEDEAGQTVRPPKARTWAPRGHTPIVRVAGRDSGRVSIAALVCAKPGARTRLLYRLRLHRPGTGTRRSFAEADYATLLSAAHHYLQAPTMLVWDNLNTHRSTAMRGFIAAHTDWLTVAYLPSYAPELNPAEGVWAHLKSSLGNLAACGLDPLTSSIKTRLTRLQYRPNCLTGFLAETGLTLEPL